jgi:hypothetical protein
MHGRGNDGDKYATINLAQSNPIGLLKLNYFLLSLYYCTLKKQPIIPSLSVC